MKATYKVSLTSLKSCLVNLPQSLERNLIQSNIAAQNVVAVLTFKSTTAYAGWTGHGSAKTDTLELDPAFARNLGIIDGQELQIDLKIDPPEAEVVWVEPLTADDWEMMELHATFLETNLLSQIRAVSHKHPLTIYLSAHTTATVIIKKIEPDLSAGLEFAKLSSSAEVVVSPKVRHSTSSAISKPKSTTSNPARGPQGSQQMRRDLFLRAVPDHTSELKGLNVFVPASILRSFLSMSKYLEVQVVIPPSLKPKPMNGDVIPPIVPSKDSVAEQVTKVASKIVVRAFPVDDISEKHIRLSASAIRALDVETGSRLRLRPAGSPKRVSSLTYHRIAGPTTRKEIKIGAKGGDKVLDSFKTQLSALQEGPVTHGLKLEDFVVGLQNEGDWSTLPGLDKLSITKGDDIAVPEYRSTSLQTQALKGVDKIIAKVTKVSGRGGGALLYGSRGSGKSVIVTSCAQEMEKKKNHHIVVADCTKLSEERLPTIRDAMQQWFAQAAWYEPSILLIDDLDRLCPAEVEHADSTRARQIAEAFLSVLRRFVPRHTIAIIASSQSKETLHTLLTTSHLFDETIALKPPNKAARREIAKSLVNDVEGELVDWLEVANLTDGYLAGDIRFMTERARHEGLMREMQMQPADQDDSSTLQTVDYEKAITGFTPASLRGIKLQKSTVAWADIGGLTETRRILLETLEWPTRYAPIFANCPLRLRSGLLLYGYPGCGKTLLASAVASECGLNFIAVKGPEILNKYIGASEKSVRDLFDRAQAAKPCVLFFDEFDSIAPKRGHDSTGVTDRVVNQMLTQMDGAEGLDGVYVLAATSRPDLIDPALLRPGRLDKSLLCDMPNHRDRVSILEALSHKMHLADDVNLSQLATETAGFSGADLQAVLYNAHLEAIHDVLSQREEEMSSSQTLLTDGNMTKQPTTFTRFRLGDATKSTKEVAAQTSADLAAVTARVEAILTNAAQESSKQTVAHAAQEAIVVIAWRNLEGSLSTTKASISAAERRRLDKIYHDFVDGRSPDGLRDGQVAPGEQRATLA